MTIIFNIPLQHHLNHPMFLYSDNNSTLDSLLLSTVDVT